MPEKTTGKKEQPFTVFVKNCPKDWSHADVFDHFKQYGEVLSAKMSIDGNHNSRGYAFVTFETTKSGLKAIAESNGLPHSKLTDGSPTTSDKEEKLIVSEFLQK